MNPLKKVWIGKSKKRLSLLLIIFLCFTCVTLVIVNAYVGERKPVENNVVDAIEEPIIEEPVVLEEVIPDEQTEFFSKEEGKALLYYSIVNDSVRFYKTNGKDPLTGKDLQPVTQDIIDKYKESIVKKEELAIVDTRSYKVNEVKIIKKEKKPVKKPKPKRESIWNTALVNSAQEDEISLFVFDENNKTDVLLKKRLKEEFANKNYFVTENIIHADELNNEIVTHLKNSNVEYFEGNLKKYTDYICIGIASYSFAQNRYRNDLTDCTLQIDYFIYDASSGAQMFAEKDKLVGSGQTNKLAKEEAVKKFIL